MCQMKNFCAIILWTENWKPLEHISANSKYFMKEVFQIYYRSDLPLAHFKL